MGIRVVGGVGGSSGGVSPIGGVSPTDNPGGPWPSWRNGLPLGVFSSISGTGSMSGLNASAGVLQATIDDYNGLVAAGNSIYTAANGGHNNSSQNKVCKIDLWPSSGLAPAWTVLDNGSASAGFEVAYNSDGRPASRHTGYNLQYVPQLNRIMAVTAWAYWGTGNYNDSFIDGFNLATNTWDAAGTWAKLFPTGVSFGPVQSCAVDPATGDCFVSGAPYQGQSLWRWQRSSNTWSRWAAWNATAPTDEYLTDWYNRASMVDTLRNRLMGFIDIAGSNKFQMLDLAVPAVRTLYLSQQISNFQYPGLVHDLDNDRYVIAAGAGVWAVNPTTGVTTSIATVTPGVNGTYTRLLYMQGLGGIVYLPTFASTIQFMPTRSLP